jgi:hypothetical protein
MRFCGFLVENVEGWGEMPQFGEKARLLSFDIPTFLVQGVGSKTCDRRACSPKRAF